MPKEKLKIFVVSWNMGNAEQIGLKNVFDERQAINQYDIIVVGLQESTYTMKGQSNSDCLAHLSKQIHDIIGSGYIQVIDQSRLES